MASWISEIRQELRRKALPSELQYRVHISSTSQQKGVLSDEIIDFTQYAKIYATHTWSRRAINILGDNVARIPLVVKDKNDEVVENHDITRALTYVNDRYGPVELWKMWTSHMMLGGEAFMEVVNAKSGNKTKVTEFWARRPDKVGVIPDKTRPDYPTVAGYSFGDLIYEPDEMIQWRFDNPLSVWRGMSLISAVRSGITIDVFAQAWSKGFLQNGGRPDWALVAPQGTTRGEREELEEKLGSKFMGLANQHRPIVLEEGVYDIKVLSFPPKDMEWMEQRKMARDEIAAIFGIPDILMGFGDDTYDTQEKRDAALSTLWILTLVPLLEFRDNQLNQFFTKVRPMLKDGEYIESNLSNIGVLQADTASKIPLIDTLWGKGMPMSEINAYLDLGMMEYPGWERGFLPFGLVAVEHAGAPPARRSDPEDTISPGDDPPEKPDDDEPVTPPEGEPDDQDEKAVIGPMDTMIEPWAAPKHMVEFLARKSRGKVNVALYRSEMHVQRVKDLDDVRQPYEDQFTRRLGKAMQEQQNRVVGNLREANKNLKDLPEEVVIPTDLWDEFIENEAMYDALYPIVVAQFSEFGGLALGILPGDVDPFDPTHPYVQEAIRTITEYHSVLLNDTTWAGLQPVLSSSLREGLGIPQIADAMNDYFNGRKEKWQRERIARTLVTGIQNEADMQAWDQSGIVEGRIWYAALDSRVRDSHAIAHGQWAPITGYFEVGGHLARIPGDPNLPAEEIVNCRCTTLPDVRPIREVIELI